ncbi:hypothetical protein V6N13_085502 [Hibiscus sabdariffa]
MSRHFSPLTLLPFRSLFVFLVSPLHLQTKSIDQHTKIQQNFKSTSLEDHVFSVCNFGFFLLSDDQSVVGGCFQFSGGSDLPKRGQATCIYEDRVVKGVAISVPDD